MSIHQPLNSPIMLISVIKVINYSSVMLTCALWATQGLSPVLHFLIIWLIFSQLKQEKTTMSFLCGGGCCLSIGVIRALNEFPFLIRLTILQLWSFNHFPNGFRTTPNFILLFETTKTFLFFILSLRFFFNSKENN